LKTYRPAPELLAEIEELLEHNRPGFGRSPLDKLIESLSRGRHYAWVGIYLSLPNNAQSLVGAGGSLPETVTSEDSRTRILVSMKIAGREVGVLAAESDKEFGFGHTDRVLLENVADVLARFLSGRGEYLVRKARQAGKTQVAGRAVAAGEK
jgi:hypothetical protein